MGLAVDSGNFSKSVTEYHSISDLEYVILVIINFVIIILGISGNSIVLYGSLRYNALKLGRITTLFLENIALSDILLVLLKYIPMLAVLLGNSWTLGTHMCWFLGTFSNLPLYNEVLLTSALTFYRLWIIKLPKAARDRLKPIHAKLFILGIAVISLLFCLFPHMLSNVSVYFEPRVFGCTTTVFQEHLKVWRIMLIVLIGIPVCSLLVSNTILLAILIQSARKARKKPSRSVAIVFIVSTIFLLSYLPLGIRSSWRQLKQTNIYIYGYITSLNLIFNPIVYYVVNTKFRVFLRSSIERRFSGKKDLGEETHKLRTSDTSTT